MKEMEAENDSVLDLPCVGVRDVFRPYLGA